VAIVVTIISTSMVVVICVVPFVAQEEKWPDKSTRKQLAIKSSVSASLWRLSSSAETVAR
jgi:hypothetical protein